MRSLFIWGAFICLALFYLVSALLGGPSHCAHLLAAATFVDLPVSKVAWKGIKGRLSEREHQESSSVSLLSQKTK